jgi:tyrosyl-tRNA synthetase
MTDITYYTDIFRQAKGPYEKAYVIFIAILLNKLISKERFKSTSLAPTKTWVKSNQQYIYDFYNKYFKSNDYDVLRYILPISKDDLQKILPNVKVK